MGEVYSHLSEGERQVIQIEIGNGTSIRRIGLMPGRNASTVSREIKRNTWFPSNENESYRPKRLKTGPWTGRYYIAGPAQRKTDRRRAKPRKRYRLSCERLWARVAEWPGRGWSPLPIGGRLRVLFPDDSAMRGWPNGRVAAGRRCPSAAGCASCSPTTPPCACARRPSTVGSTPTAIAVSAGHAAFHAATGGGAGVAAGGRRVSRFPDGFPSPSVRRKPATATVSAIGRPTT